MAQSTCILHEGQRSEGAGQEEKRRLSRRPHRFASRAEPPGDTSAAVQLIMAVHAGAKEAFDGTGMKTQQDIWMRCL